MYILCVDKKCVSAKTNGQNYFNCHGVFVYIILLVIMILECTRSDYKFRWESMPLDHPCLGRLISLPCMESQPLHLKTFSYASDVIQFCI